MHHTVRLGPLVDFGHCRLRSDGEHRCNEDAIQCVHPWPRHDAPDNALCQLRLSYRFGYVQWRSRVRIRCEESARSKLRYGFSLPLPPTP